MKPLLQTLPAIFMMGAIFFLSSLQGDQLDIPTFRGLDKIVHATIYALLAGTYLFAMTPRFRLAYPKPAMFLAWVGSVCYGISDEVHQHFVPGRSPDIYDIAADGCGAALIVIIYYRAIRLKQL